MRTNFLSLKNQKQDLLVYLKSIVSKIPPPTPRNLWLALCSFVALQNLVVFTNSQITGNAITALIVWGGALICMEDLIEDLKPSPSILSLIVGSLMIMYTLFRTSLIINSDSFLYFLVPFSGFGLVLLVASGKSVFKFKDSILILCLLPLFVIVQILVTNYVTDDLSLLTAKFVLFWLNILGISPATLNGNTVYVNGGAVQVMHECNGFEMIMQMIITAVIFLVAFPLRSRIGRLFIITISPLLGFLVNSFRISLLAIFTSFNSDQGKHLFDFFHEQAGSLIFSGLSVFIFGYIYLAVLERELPPISE